MNFRWGLIIGGVVNILNDWMGCSQLCIPIRWSMGHLWHNEYKMLLNLSATECTYLPTFGQKLRSHGMVCINGTPNKVNVIPNLKIDRLIMGLGTIVRICTNHGGPISLLKSAIKFSVWVKPCFPILLKFLVDRRPVYSALYSFFKDLVCVSTQSSR